MSRLEYSVLLEPLPLGEGGGFLATVPDLPGSMSDGETPEEAVANIQDAILAWMEAARARNPRGGRLSAKGFPFPSTQTRTRPRPSR